METYIGYIKTPQDALIVFEACRKNQLNRVQRRLSSKERIQIQSGSVFAWDEREAGMRRWTDGRTWSPSRVLGSFLTYKELDTKRRPRRTLDSKSPLCVYKSNGLIKQSFSICTATNQKLHLISYYLKSDILSGKLKQPSQDPALSEIHVPKGLYPELNPLDTSGGHTATFHNLKSSLILASSSMSITDDDTPSLSSSPSNTTSSSPSDDDDIINYSDSMTTNNTTTTTVPSSMLLNYTLPLPFPQDIPWGKLPFTEDKRQLNALQNLLRL